MWIFFGWLISGFKLFWVVRLVKKLLVITAMSHDAAQHSEMAKTPDSQFGNLGSTPHREFTGQPSRSSLRGRLIGSNCWQSVCDWTCECKYVRLYDSLYVTFAATGSAIATCWFTAAVRHLRSWLVLIKVFISIYNLLAFNLRWYWSSVLRSFIL